MKKLLFKFATVITALAVIMGTMAGCGLFVVNTDRDMNQVVATVQISDKVEKTNIYKRDLAAGYVNYGYYYVQYYSYTQSKAYQTVLDNLVNNAIVSQQAKIDMADKVETDNLSANLTALKDDGGVNYLSLLASDADVAEFRRGEGKKHTVGSDDYNAALAGFVYNKYSAKTTVDAKDAGFRFVSLKDVYKAISDTADSAESLIKTFVENNDEDSESADDRGGKISYTVRATPTKKTEEEDKSDDELIAGYKKNIAEFADFMKLNKNVTALKKAVKRFTDLGVLLSSVKYNPKNIVSILNVSYFRSAVDSAINSALVEKYEDKLRSDNEVNSGELWAQYKALYNAQSAQYQGNVTDYESKLSEVSANTFLVYEGSANYGYISHLLIPYTDEQKQAITDYKEKEAKTQADVDAKVATYLTQMVAKDLRDTWVKSDYGVYNGGEFTFDNKYIYDETDGLNKYMGTIGYRDYYTEKNDEGKLVYNYRYFDLKPTEMNYNDFSALAYKVITGEDGTFNVDTNYTIPASMELRKSFERFEDLKFAFSTDTGNFNKYLGYVYSPFTSAAQYVSAFNAACKEVMTGGAGTFRMFMSEEYGLHIVLCTKKVGAGMTGLDYQYDVNDETDGINPQFKADLETEGTVAYNFKKMNAELVENNYISKIATKIVNGNADKVSYNKKAYSDLITE